MTDISNDKQETGPQGLKAVMEQSFKEVVEPFIHLVKAPRSLWGINVSYMLEGLAYFGILTILGKYLSENVGLEDLHAGWVYSGLTGGITLAMLFLGGVADRIGVRKALLVSLCFMIFGRLCLAASGTFFEHGAGAGSPMFFTVAVGLFIIVIGYGMYQPAAYAGIKQFTDEKTATMGYAMIYGLMNLGAFFSGIISPPIRLTFGIVSVYWVYVGLTVLAFLSVLFILTRAAEKKDTVARKKPEGDSESDKDEKKALLPRPVAPVFTPRFFVYLAGLAVAVAATIYLGATSPFAPVQEAFDTHVGGLQQANKKLEKAIASAEEVKALKEAPEPDSSLIAKAGETAASSLKEAADALAAAEKTVAAVVERIEPPRNAEASVVVSPVAFGLLKASVASDAVLLRLLSSDPAALECSVTMNTEQARTVRTAVRSLGIAYMTLAYALVDKVDAHVIEELQLRMKLVKEDRIPLEDGEVKRFIAMASLPVPEMASSMAALSDETAQKMEKLDGCGAGLDSILQAEADFWTQAARLAPKDIDAASRKFIEERALTASVHLINDIAPMLVTNEAAAHDSEKPESGGETGKDDADSSEAQTTTGVQLVQARLTAGIGFVETMRSTAISAARKPLLDRLLDWLTRYGLAVLAGLVFIILLTMDLLNKRPDHPFHNSRFVFFIFVLIPVQTLFAHNWLTLPYYINRAFGGTAVGDNFEFFSNLNPILIFFLSPAVAALTARRQVFNMMIWGTLVMALPTFLLVLTPSPTLLIVYILLMSIGEAMWQPRFLQWVAEIAPEGKTGAYMGIAQFPWFMTKVITGLYSGYFLSQYCPMVGPQNTQMLWFIYALIAMVSPVALWMTRHWMRKGVN